jgi:myosin heavy subunit
VSTGVRELSRLFQGFYRDRVLSLLRVLSRAPQVGKSKVFLRQAAYEQLERLRNAKLRAAATTLSSRQRGRAALQSYRSTLRGCAVLQRAVRVLAARRAAAAARTLRRSATAVQAGWRGRGGRRAARTLRCLRAATRLAAWARGRQPRRALLKQRWAAVACQCRRRVRAAKLAAAARRRAAKDFGNVQVE